MTTPAAAATEVEVRNVMAMARRGAVLIGYVRSGAPRVGQVTQLLAFAGREAVRLELIGVERLSSMEAGNVAVGLVFRNPPTLAEFGRALPPGSQIHLTDPAI